MFSKLKISFSSDKEKIVKGIENHFKKWFSDEKMWYDAYDVKYDEEIEKFRETWLFSCGSSMHFDNKYDIIENPTQLRVALHTLHQNLHQIKNYEDFDEYLLCEEDCVGGMEV